MEKYLGSVLPFLSVVEAVKTLPRTGWGLRGVPNPEHVGDHMYQMAMLCMACPNFEESERLRAVQMAVVHDAGEAIVGDITPSDGVSREEKALRENLAFKFFDCLLKPSSPGFAAELAGLWREYEENETKVAQFVNQVDKLECIQQAAIYDKRTHGKISRLNEFRALRAKITEPWLSELADQTLAEWDAAKARRESTAPMIFLIGGPGVGKGTQGARAAEEFNFAHISLGDLLRKERGEPGSLFGDFIDESMKNSIIVPALLSMMLLKGSIEAALAEGKAGVLLDGFPRSVQQATAFEEEISDRYSTIFLDCSAEDMVARIKGRASSSGRTDDSPEVVAKRLETFNATNEGVVNHLKRNPLHRIDGAGSPDEVYIAMKKAIEGILGDKTTA